MDEVVVDVIIWTMIAIPFAMLLLLALPEIVGFIVQTIIEIKCSVDYLRDALRGDKDAE